MMTRDEAISQLEAGGFRAFKQDGPVGETLAVGPRGGSDGPESASGSLAKLIQLFPIQDKWVIHAPELLVRTDYSRRYPLAEACDIARKLLECEYLPVRQESILIHLVRSEGGGYRLLEHVPTGIRKMLSQKNADGREVFLTREQAMIELAYELALGSSAAG